MRDRHNGECRASDFVETNGSTPRLIELECQPSSAAALSVKPAPTGGVAAKRTAYCSVMTLIPLRSVVSAEEANGSHQMIRAAATA